MREGAVGPGILLVMWTLVVGFTGAINTARRRRASVAIPGCGATGVISLRVPIGYSAPAHL